MNKLSKIKLQLINKGNLHADVVLPDGLVLDMDQPVHSVLGMLVTCESHLLKYWSEKLKIDL